jgi:hypothetical protein
MSGEEGDVLQAAAGEVCLDADKRGAFGVSPPSPPASITSSLRRRQFPVAQGGQKRDSGLEAAGNLANVGLIQAAQIRLRVALKPKIRRR